MCITRLYIFLLHNVLFSATLKFQSDTSFALILPERNLRMTIPPQRHAANTHGTATLIVHKRLPRRLLTQIHLLYLLLLPPIMSAHTVDTLNIYYPLNSSEINSAFADNRSQIERLDSSLLTGYVDSIHICPSASPDGRMTVNINLRAQRAQSIINHIDSVVPRHSIVLRTFPQPIDWNKVLQQVHADTSFPFRDRVIAILEDTGKSPYAIQMELKTLDNGKVYDRIASGWLADERFVTCRLFTALPGVATQPDIAATDTVFAEYIDNTPPAPVTGTYYPPASPADTIRKSIFPLRITTSPLQWLALAPNGGVEIPLDGNDNLSLTYSCAWWSNLGHKHVYRWMKGEIGWQHYFRNQPPHDNRGIYAGIYLNTGLFELMFSSTDRKGEYYGLAPAAGYRWRLGNHFSLTAEAGIGTAYVSYRHAHYMGHTLIYRGKATRWSVFPRIGVNLIYNFNSMKR